MNKKSYKPDIRNLVATEGFEYSGSGLVNDMFKHSGYIVPKNIRADELFDNGNNFSWPKAINNEYNFFGRLFGILSLFKVIFLRIPLNLMQTTPFYKKYLHSKGRDVEMHQPSSVNRSIWSYLVSVYMLIAKYNFNEVAFLKWLGIKYKWQTLRTKNLLIDNGIPKDNKILQWLFKMESTTGIYVYREPRIQFQQIVEVSKSTNKKAPTYDEFLKGLEVQYQSLDWVLNSNYRIMMISFDDLLLKTSYRNKLELYFNKMNILNKINFDFTESIINNENISLLSKNITPSENSLNIENTIISYHKLFEDRLNSILQES